MECTIAGIESWRGPMDRTKKCHKLANGMPMNNARLEAMAWTDEANKEMSRGGQWNAPILTVGIELLVQSNELNKTMPNEPME